MKKLILTILFFIAVAQLHFTQFRYAPLQLGNVWVYKDVIYNGLMYRAEIVDSAVTIDTLQYFGYGIAYPTYSTGFLRSREDSFYVSKEDSTLPEPNNELIYYKKDAQIGDTWQVDYGNGNGGIAIYTITDTLPAYIFDTLVTAKILNENFGLVEWDYIWTEEFGQLSQENWLGEVQYYLKGCIINGQVYGDTTFIISSVGDDELLVDEFYLYQNYPNPFNPTTKIKYTIPSNVKSEISNVALKIYDVLGNEVVTLVNEEKLVGTFELEFNADRHSRGGGNVPSGVYFYQLRAGNFSETKKMILLK